MAVESRFVVVRNGVEVETFMDKKTADEYDKMLDMADNLSALLEQSELQLNENHIEEISIYLAKNREDILIALQAKKPKAVKAVKAAEAAPVVADKVTTKAEPKAKPKVKKSA
ncbi:YebG family protein [Thalassotalea litorea]|uniref:YebG family protein n=1 Tax=Thalassotalea litorea TaxID=2020715 RepID=UPI0037354FBB